MARPLAINGMDKPLDKDPPGRARETGPVLEFHYRFLLWLVSAVEHFPCRQKLPLTPPAAGAFILPVIGLSISYPENRLMKLPRAWPVMGGLLLLLAAPADSVAQESAFTKPVAPDFSAMKDFYTQEQARKESKQAAEQAAQAEAQAAAKTREKMSRVRALELRARAKLTLELAENAERRAEQLAAEADQAASSATTTSMIGAGAGLLGALYAANNEVAVSDLETLRDEIEKSHRKAEVAREKAAAARRAAEAARAEALAAENYLRELEQGLAE